MATIYGFYQDKAFLSLDFIKSYDATGGMCVLSNRAHSNFKNAKVITDVNEDRAWFDGFTPSTSGELIVDGTTYSDFIAIVEDLDEASRNALFAILDRIFILNSGTETASDINTDMITNSSIYPIYVPASLSISTSTINGTVYTASDTSVTAPSWAIFSITVTVDEETTEHMFKIWVDNGDFETDYPISTIEAMIPILDYNTLLTGPLVSTGSNVFTSAITSATSIKTNIDTKLRTVNTTGFHLQNILFRDSLSNARTVPFGILYKGPVPDLLNIRTAIRTGVLNSGVGTESAWRARASELFVINQFYIVPMWDIVTERVDETIYPGISSIIAMINKTKTALAHISSSTIDDKAEHLDAVYDSMKCICVPNEDNVSADSIYEIHPTYQDYTASEPGFLNMASSTKTFSSYLSIALAVAAGKTTNELYQERVEGNRTYIPFVVDTTEYYVMTKNSYLDAIAG